MVGVESRHLIFHNSREEELEVRESVELVPG